MRLPLVVAVRPLRAGLLEQLVERALGQRRVEAEVGQRRIGTAAQPVGGGHRAPARRPDLRQLERAAVAVEQQPVALGAHEAAGGREGRAVDAGRGHAEERAVGQRQPRADVRPQRAHGALDLLRRLRRVQRPLARADLVRVGDLRTRPARRGVGALVERLDEQLGAERLQPRGERAVVVVAGRSARSPSRRPAPESQPAVTRMIATPVSASPAMIARSIGAAPRQRGSSDGCTLIIS